MLLSYKSTKGVFGTLVICSFGFYLTSAPGIRLDQILVYMLTLILIPQFLLKVSEEKFNKWVLSLFFVYLAIVVLVLVRSSFNVHEDILGTLQEVEALLQTLCVMFLIIIGLQGKNHGQISELISSSLFLCLVMLSLNTFLVLGSLFFDLWPLIKILSGQSAIPMMESKVWLRTINAGRPVGVFNMPFESGLAYSLGLLLYVYMAANSHRRPRKFFRAILVALVIVGGWMSGSKVFLFLGIPLSLMYLLVWWIFYEKRKGVQLISSIVALVMLLFVFFALTSFQEVGLMSSLFKTDYLQEKPALQVISGGRFGKNTQTKIEMHFLEAWDQRYFGQGIPLNYAVDNAYLQMFAYGGFTTLFLYFLWLALPVIFSLQVLKYKPGESLLIIMLVALAVGSGMGAPVLQINRVSILLCCFLFMLVALLKAKTYVISEYK